MKIEVAVLNSGLFILIEDVTADVHDKCLCILCDKKLKYKTLNGKGYFQHQQHQCYLKNNYDSVLKQCQISNEWKLQVCCATPACNHNVHGTYTISAECTSKIISQALQTKQYCIKAGTEQFPIRPLYCTLCIRTPVFNAKTIHGLDTRITVAKHKALEATKTQLRSENQKKNAIKELQRAQKQLKNASELCKKDLLIEKKALEFVIRVREEDESERNQEQQRLDAEAETTRQEGLAIEATIKKKVEAENAKQMTILHITLKEKEQKIRAQHARQLQAVLDANLAETERLQITLTATANLAATKRLQTTHQREIESSRNIKKEYCFW